MAKRAESRDAVESPADASLLAAVDGVVAVGTALGLYVSVIAGAGVFFVVFAIPLALVVGLAAGVRYDGPPETAGRAALASATAGTLLIGLPTALDLLVDLVRHFDATQTINPMGVAMFVVFGGAIGLGLVVGAPLVWIGGRFGARR